MRRLLKYQAKQRAKTASLKQRNRNSRKKNISHLKNPKTGKKKKERASSQTSNSMNFPASYFNPKVVQMGRVEQDCVRRNLMRLDRLLRLNKPGKNESKKGLKNNLMFDSLR